MAHKITLSRYLVEQQRVDGLIPAQLRLLLEVVARACKSIHPQKDGKVWVGGAPIASRTPAYESTVTASWPHTEFPDLAARVETHNAGRGAKYTRGRLPVTVAWKKVTFCSPGANRWRPDIAYLALKPHWCSRSAMAWPCLRWTGNRGRSS